jgi:ATP phosphoribosyltransferase regulatory subunit
MSRSQIRALFETAGYRFIEPSILQPADVFLDLAGEDIRTRLFITQDRSGAELCMRPEMTIPVCRMHMNNGEPSREGFYAYLGPVFRFRDNEPGEFLQAGIENIGNENKEEADAEVLSLALGGCQAGGMTKPLVTLGDSAILMKAIESLGLLDHQARKLRRCVGDLNQLRAMLKTLSQPQQDNGLMGHAGVLAAMEGSSSEAARAVVEDLISLAGIKLVGGRSAHEIAERFLQQAAQQATPPLSAEAIEILDALASVDETAEDAVKRLKELSAQSGLKLTSVLSVYERRLEAIEKRGINPKALRFMGYAGGRLDYYTGFSFDVRIKRDALPSVSGGRFDRLMTMLGSDKPVPAVGAALWLDRMPKGMDA